MTFVPSDALVRQATELLMARLDWPKFWVELQKKVEIRNVGLMTSVQANKVYRELVQELIEKMIKGEV